MHIVDIQPQIISIYLDRVKLAVFNGQISRKHLVSLVKVPYSGSTGFVSAPLFKVAEKGIKFIRILLVLKLSCGGVRNGYVLPLSIRSAFFYSPLPIRISIVLSSPS